MSLAKLGMPEEGIEIAAKLAIQNPYPNPRPVTEDGIRALLARAYTGAMPQSAELEPARSEEHTSELQSLMRISYAVFCLKKKNTQYKHLHHIDSHTQLLINSIY